MAEYNTVPAKEIPGGLIEITLPSGKTAKVRQIRENGNSPVKAANLREFEDGGFQVSHLEYEDGNCSHYLGNVFLNQDDDGICY